MQRPEEEPARTCRDSYLEQVSGGVLNEGGCDDESWCRIRLFLSRAAVYTAKPPNNATDTNSSLSRFCRGFCRRF